MRPVAFAGTLATQTSPAWIPLDGAETSGAPGCA